MKKMYLKVFGLLLLGSLVLLMGGLVGTTIAADSSPFTIRVQSDDGRAISGVTVEVLSAGSGIVVASGVTDSSGQVSFELDAGSYRLRVSSGSLYFSSDECGPKTSYDVPPDNSATITFGVTWFEGDTPTNQPPVLDPIGDKVVDEGELLTFTILATDPDGDPLTYSASNMPSGATFDPATQTFSWIPGYDQAGTYTGVDFEVSDGSLTSSEDITITVADVNRPPVVNLVTANPNQLWPPNHKAVDVVISVDATNPDGDIVRITYSVADEYGIYDVPETDLPDDGVISLIAWRDGEDKDGRVYTITVTVYDAEGISESGSIEVVVPHDQGKKVK